MKVLKILAVYKLHMSIGDHMKSVKKQVESKRRFSLEKQKANL